jgi:glyoxylase-like metal-dependent hydrolase (beta-lactamase superfamily II)
MQVALEQSIPVQSRALGDFELTVLSDGNYWLDGGAFFGVVPKTLWSRRREADEQNRLATGMNSVLVRTGEHNVLIETGAGSKLGDKMKAIYEPGERLLRSFEEAGVGPDEIDIVINTHLHFDHCGWNTMRRNGSVAATFPRATYYVQEGEWRHAREQHERDRVSYISENYDPLVESGEMRLLRGDREIVPGISVRVLPGHTRNMQAVLITSGGQTACYISDLVPTTAHIEITWVMAFDLFPLETIDNRKRVYEEAIPQRWLMLWTHDPVVPWSYVERDAKGRLVSVVAT